MLLLFPQGTKDEPNVPTPTPTTGAILRPTLRVRLLYYVGDVDELNPWTALDVSSRTTAVTSTHGRSSRTSGVADPGTMTLVLDNTDGLLDPENTSSVLHGKIKPGGPHGTRFSVEHLFEGSYRPLGFGVLDSIDRAWGGGGPWSQSVVTTVDFTHILAAMIPAEGQSLGRQTASERIDSLLFMFSRTGERFLQGQTWQYAIQPSSRRLHALRTDGRTSLWEYISQAAFSDGGLAYFDPRGIFRFQSGMYRLNRGVLAVMGDDEPTEIEVASDLTYRLTTDDVVVEAAFTTHDGRHTAAVGKFGEYANHDGAEASGTATMLSDMVQVQSLARHIYTRDSPARRSVEQVTLDVLAAYEDFRIRSPYRTAMDLTISDRVVVNRRPPGGGSILSNPFHIEAITHAIEAGRQWTTTYRLAPASALQSHWQLGQSRLAESTHLTW